MRMTTRHGAARARRTIVPAAIALTFTLLLVFTSSVKAAREGDAAPAFELPNTMAELVRRADHDGAPAVLVFYRGFF